MTKWISVSDQLPPESGRYLMWEKYYSGSTNSVCVGYYNAFLDRFETEIAEDYSNVTYWMPIPAPPEGG